MVADGKSPTAIGLNAVIVAVTAEEPRILILHDATDGLGEAAQQWPGSRDALPFGPFEPEHHRTLDSGLRRWVQEQTGLDLGYVEQLYTFADRNRDPRELAGGPRVVSIGYLALVREAQPSGAGNAEWRSWYDYFPWEDWREGRPALIDAAIRPQLIAWMEAAASPETRARRRERLSINFGHDEAAWDFERVLERYELLYGAGLIAEAERDRHMGAVPSEGDQPAAARLPMIEATGYPLALDHRRILATALGRLRGKLKYRPVVFELLPPSFTLLQLQRVAEALAGVRLHKQNFRRLVINTKLVEPTGKLESHTGGRPAELFRFRREVLRERPTPGVAIPTFRIAG